MPKHTDPQGILLLVSGPIVTGMHVGAAMYTSQKPLRQPGAAAGHDHGGWILVHPPK
jgi:hypothetical protein